jgi:ankyrin repeat protein
MVKFLPYNMTHQYSDDDIILDAVLENNICVTKFVLKHKIDINKQYRYGHTLLHNAALYGDINMVKLLVKNGAKLIKNDFGLTAIDSARDNGYNDVVEYLVGCYSDFGRMGENKGIIW